MKKPTGVAITVMLVAGCTGLASSNLKGSNTLVLTPRVINGAYQSQTTVSAYTAASIDHLVLELKSGANTIASKSIPKVDLAKTVTFTTLQANTSYTVQAYAYLTNDNSTKISADGQSSVAITVTTDDRPTINSIPVKLIDIPFNGQATASGVVVTSGGYNTSIPEGMSFLTPLGIVSTIAGNGNNGSQDGTGVNATFNNPYGIAPDNQGNIYIADTYNNRIRKINSAGVVTTFAGSAQGYANGIGTAASFNRPFALAIDAQSNIYVADTDNNCIRKITSAGVVSTLAGGGGATAAGYADGTGTAAKFYRPYGITVTPSGTVYLSDLLNNVIRKITPEGGVSTVAGGGGGTIGGYAEGNGTEARFGCPWGVGLDPQGNLYVSDNNNHRVRKVSITGVVTTLAGSSQGFTNATGAAAKFNWPESLAVDSVGNVYVADNANHVIRKITPAGVVSTLAGGGGGTISGYADGTGAAARFMNPRAVSVDDSGHVYVGEYIAPRIRVIQ